MWVFFNVEFVNVYIIENHVCKAIRNNIFNHRYGILAVHHPVTFNKYFKVGIWTNSGKLNFMDFEIVR